MFGCGPQSHRNPTLAQGVLVCLICIGQERPLPISGWLQRKRALALQLTSCRNRLVWRSGADGDVGSARRGG